MTLIEILFYYRSKVALHGRPEAFKWLCNVCDDKLWIHIEHSVDNEGNFIKDDGETFSVGGYLLQEDIDKQRDEILAHDFGGDDDMPILTPEQLSQMKPRPFFEEKLMDVLKTENKPVPFGTLAKLVNVSRALTRLVVRSLIKRQFIESNQIEGEEHISLKDKE